MRRILPVAAGLAAAVVLYREWLLNQEAPQRHHEPFDGAFYRVGNAAIAERRSERPTATVICMHGYIEDMRYFTDYYRDPSIQLIVLTSCDYHVPVKDPEFTRADWIRRPSAKPASIAYDAEVLVQALEHLPRTGAVRVHGHSRGGAVALEAARLRPDLFRDVEVILEAPVLPQGQPYAPMSALSLWLFGFFVPAWRKDPLGKRFAGGYGSLEDPRKREVLAGLPHNPRYIRTFVEGIADLGAWMRERDASIYGHVARGAVLIPDDDRVLAVGPMRASAQRAGSLTVIEVERSSHFVLFDRPDALPALARAEAAAPA